MVAKNKTDGLLNADLRGALIHLASTGKDVSNKTIIEKTGLKKSAISGYLSGKASASAAFIKKFEEVYGIKVEGCAHYLHEDALIPEVDEYKEKYIKLLEESKINSDFLATSFEAIEGLLKEIYVEIRKQREMTEKRMSSNRDTSKV